MMTLSWRNWYWKLCSASFLAIGGAIASSWDCALAQIIPDNTLGAESSAVIPLDPELPVDVIDGGATRGANLFHSFREFNVSEGRGAYFTNPVGIENILSRVTGANPSNILGKLGVLGNANLFLINPNGIIFGPNASLDVGGSFVASTASSLRFADGTEFSATAPQTTPLLTISVPLGLQFGGGMGSPLGNSGPPLGISGRGGTAGSILSQSQATNSTGYSVNLQVQPGKTLALIGGNVSVDNGILDVPGGRVELGGIAGAGTVGLNVDANNLSLSFPNDVERADVSLTNGTLVYVAGGGGSIAVNARNLDILGGSTLFGGISEDLGAQNSQAGDITLNATGTITVAGTKIVTFPEESFESESSIFNSVQPEAVGKGGNINIRTRSLSLSDSAQIGADTSGQGDAGSILIQADDSVSVANSSSISSRLSSEAVGKGGDINIQTRSLSLSDSAQIGADTFGQGDAGSILIQASDSVSLNNSLIVASVFSGARGKGGDINIQTRSLSLSDSAQIGADTSGQGDAGSILIQASDSVLLMSNSYISSANRNISSDLKVGAGNSVGNGGDINIQTGSLTLADNADLSTNTSGLGNAGSVFIRASGPVLLENSYISTLVSGIVGSRGMGKGGDINILALSLSLDNSLLATSTFAEGNSGAVFVRTDRSISLTNNSRVVSAVGPEAVGNGGDIDLQTRSLSLTSGSQLFSSVVGEQVFTSLFDSPSQLENASQLFSSFPNPQDILAGGQGQGGNIWVNATDSVALSGIGADGRSTGFFSSTGRGANGRAGDTVVNTSAFRITDGAVVNAQTKNASDGGNITINVNTFEAVNGGQVLTTTSDRGKAGNITVNAIDSATISGSDPTFAARLAQFGKDAVTNEGSNSGLFAGTSGAGTAGDLTIATGQLIVRDGAKVSVSSVGLESGDAGNLEVQARSISLNNSGKLIAETQSGQGGDMTLLVQDLLLLRRNSQISTTAGTALAGGDGGNITIDSKFIVAVPAENSDITANAYTGKGGSVEVTASGIFGTQFREQQTPESDITATSDFGVDGVVEINTLDIDPSRGLVALPAQPTDTEVAQACQPGGSQDQSEFVITGRGGLPPNPKEALSSDAIQVNWVTLNPGVENRSSPATTTNRTAPEPAPIVEAQGWVIGPNGEVVLTASSVPVLPHSSWQTPANCHGS